MEVRQGWHAMIAALVKQARGVWLNENGEAEMTSPWANDDDDIVFGAEHLPRHSDSPDSQYVLILSPEAQAAFDDFRDHTNHA
jgi:hypothetical protein